MHACLHALGVIYRWLGNAEKGNCGCDGKTRLETGSFFEAFQAFLGCCADFLHRRIYLYPTSWIGFVLEENRARNWETIELIAEQVFILNDIHPVQITAELSDEGFSPTDTCPKGSRKGRIGYETRMNKRVV